MYSLFDLVLLFCLILLIVYWWRITEQKQFALQNAGRYCRKRGIQLLDQTLVFSRFRLVRDDKGRMRLCRVYDFEFCRDGTDRHHGEILLAGFNVINVTLEIEHLEITQY